MDRLNKMTSYFNEKLERELDSIAQSNPGGIRDMSPKEILLACVKNNGYETPDLNDKLYLHFRCFKKIENLESYTGCKAIWLDSNGFDKIEGLDKLIELRCLYLSKNLIGRIDGLNNLVNLQILDLANNRLTMIDNLACCPNLQTLNVSHNYLATPESILHLQECPSITNLDLTNNRLPAEESFINILKDIPSLVTLSINANEVTKLPLFRKRMIAANRKLGYLDRPIDVQERTFAVAFVEGGAEAENQARQKWKEDQEAKRIAEAAAERAWRAEQQRMRQQAIAEGRPVPGMITPLTQTEIDTRAAEAQAAADAEKAMLELGIDKLATRFYQMESSNKNGSADLLDEAAKQLMAEKASREQREHREANSHPQVEELEDVSEPLPADSVDESEIQVEVLETPRELSSGVEEQKASDSPLREIETIEVESEAVIALRAEEEAAREVELREQREREMRVDESFAIYKRQLEEKRNGKSAAQPVVPVSATWDAPAAVVPDVPPEPRLYWSEVMDIELAKLVKGCVFDFDEISAKMQQNAKAGIFGKATLPELLTNEKCRVRWSQLDATQWGEMPSNSSALDTVFKVCINPAVLGAGHGNQPNFQALASLTAGAMPAYLTPPASFPRVQDMKLEDGDSDLELD